MLSQCYNVLPRSSLVLSKLLQSSAGTAKFLHTAQLFATRRAAGLVQSRSGYRNTYADIFALAYRETWETMIPVAARDTIASNGFVVLFSRVCSLESGATKPNSVEICLH